MAWTTKMTLRGLPAGFQWVAYARSTDHRFQMVGWGHTKEQATKTAESERTLRGIAPVCTTLVLPVDHVRNQR